MVSISMMIVCELLPMAFVITYYPRYSQNPVEPVWPKRDVAYYGSLYVPGPASVYRCENFNEDAECYFMGPECICVKVHQYFFYSYRFFVQDRQSMRDLKENSQPLQFTDDQTLLDVKLLGAFGVGTHLMRYDVVRDKQYGSHLRDFCGSTPKLFDNGSHIARYMLRNQIYPVKDLLRFGVRFLDIEVMLDFRGILRSSNCLQGTLLYHIYGEVLTFLHTFRLEPIILNLRLARGNSDSSRNLMKAFDKLIQFTDNRFAHIAIKYNASAWPYKINELLSEKKTAVLINIETDVLTKSLKRRVKNTMKLPLQEYAKMEYNLHEDILPQWIHIGLLDCDPTDQWESSPKKTIKANRQRLRLASETKIRLAKLFSSPVAHKNISDFLTQPGVKNDNNNAKYLTEIRNLTSDLELQFQRDLRHNMRKINPGKMTFNVALFRHVTPELGDWFKHWIDRDVIQPTTSSTTSTLNEISNVSSNADHTNSSSEAPSSLIEISNVSGISAQTNSSSEAPPYLNGISNVPRNAAQTNSSSVAPSYLIEISNVSGNSDHTILAENIESIGGDKQSEKKNQVTDAHSVANNNNNSTNNLITNNTNNN